MYKVVAVTNRLLCHGEFLDQVQKIVNSGVYGIILREKDLGQEAYYQLAKKVQKICENTKTNCILHTHIEVARKLGISRIHMPLAEARKRQWDFAGFEEVGMSIHSIEEANEAINLGATYLTAGHIYPTDCKKGVPARGLEFLKEVCDHVSIPVYAIGGMTLDKIPDVIEAGASGACIMSGFMNGMVNLEV